MTLKSYFEQHNISNDMINRIQPYLKTVRYQSGEEIVTMGEKPDAVFLILQGIVRGYYIDEDGNDITKCFSKEGDWCSYYSLLENKESPFYIEALEDCLTVKIPAAVVKEWIDSEPSLRRIYAEITQEAFLHVEEKSISLQSLDAKNRYLQFVKNSPDVNRRVKQEYIASYLGITPSSLSRIKREL